jgi:hypothetical protein
MKASSQWIRRAVLWGATGAVTAGMIVAGSSAEAAHTTLHRGSSQSHASTNNKGPGYPPPKGIYKPFTDCPLLNPLMQESVPGSATGCVAGDVSTGSIKIGNITTKIRSSATVRHLGSAQRWIQSICGRDPATAGRPFRATSQRAPVRPRRAAQGARLPEQQPHRSEVVP